MHGAGDIRRSIPDKDDNVRLKMENRWYSSYIR